MNISKDLVAASASPLILSILKDGDSYGYAIIKKVKELSRDELAWTEGMLYPVLHRLEKQQLIEAYWGSSGTGRKRKYYRLLEDGDRELQQLKSHWNMVDNTLRKSWKDQSIVTGMNQPVFA